MNSTSRRNFLQSLSGTALASLLHRVLPERITLDLSDDGQMALAEGDPSQLDQVLMNLCINARDAMPDGGRLRIRTEVVPADLAAPPGQIVGPWVAVTVTNVSEVTVTP